MSSKYIGPIKWLGGIALGAFVFAILFPIIAGAVLSEEARKAVLINAIPFFAAFVGILLLFILLIVIVAKRYNNKIPTRCYQGVEYTIIAGILGGVIFLFQPLSFVPYRYGFLLLLASTLSFIVWSHVLPRSARTEANLPALGSKQHLAGGIAALVIIVVMTVGIMSINAPKPPYGLRERTFNSYDDARKAEVASAAISNFNSVEIPFLILFSLFPAAAVYFIVREVTAERERESVPQRVAIASGQG